MVQRQHGEAMIGGLDTEELSVCMPDVDEVTLVEHTPLRHAGRSRRVHDGGNSVAAGMGHQRVWELRTLTSSYPNTAMLAGADGFRSTIGASEPMTTM